MKPRTILRRPLVLLVIGGSLLLGGCTMIGQVSRLLPLSPSAEAPISQAPAAAASSTVPASPSPAAEVPTSPTSPGIRVTPAPAPLAAARPSVTGHITAGPTCPVETEPPTPGCAPRPVAGATVVATDAAGHAVAQAISSADGSYALDLQPGTYTLTPDRWSLRMGTPPTATVSVTGAPGAVVVDFVYDTGIR